MAELTHKVTPVPKTGFKGRRKRGGAYTGYLYAEPDFWYGVGSTLDLFGRLREYNYSRTGRSADARGLYSDYLATAKDFWEAVRLFEDEHSFEELPKQYRLFDPDKL